MGSGTVAGAGLGLLDIALKDAILVSLAILGLGCSTAVVGWVVAPWVKNPV